MKARISASIVNAAHAEDRDLFIWDDAIPGFGLKVTPIGRKIYVFQYRLGGKLYRHTIGRHGLDVLSADAARDLAFIATGRIKSGRHPSDADEKPIETVAELAERYMLEYASRRKRPSSQRQDRRNIDNHIVPLIGRRRVADIEKVDILRALDAVAAGKTAKDEKTVKQGRRRVTGGEVVSNRVRALLHTMFNLAEDWKLRPGGSNPCRGVQRYKENKVERFLSAAEFSQLGAALAAAEAGQLRVHGDLEPAGKKKRGGQPKLERALSARAIAAIRLLLLTGCRPGEVTALAWADVDLDRRTLRIDSKTGRRTIFLPEPAVAILKAQPRTAGQVYVFPATPPRRPPRDGKKPAETPMGSLRRPWELLCKAAGITNARLHDLRHSFASVGAAEGFTLQMIGNLLGHSTPTTTQRYAHLKAASQQDAADAIGRHIESALGKV